MNTIRVLWIEDGAYSEARKYAPPVRTDPRYSLDIVLTATEGMAAIFEAQYDVVIVDIRLEPGSDPDWRSEHRRQRAGGEPARLGLTLLENLFGEGAQEKPDWVTADRFGVLSIEQETQIKPALDGLGVKAFHHKETLQIPTALRDLVEEILERPD